jgi:NADH:ubiquinone oxidoreductase subunit 4 (subunit M)
MLWLVQRVFFGPLKETLGTHASAGHGIGHAVEVHAVEEHDGGSHAGDGHAAHTAIHDLSWREILALTLPVVFVVWIGVYPKYFLDRMDGALQGTLQPVAAAVQELNKRDERTVELPNTTAVEELARVR